MKLRSLDLFSGIGGISLALKPYAKTVAYCEQDKHAQAVLFARMESNDLDIAPIWDDIKTLKRDALEREGICRIDLIAGGFPCQDISVAGRGQGLAGERSGLFFEVLRLAKEIQPKFLFLENVPAIRIRGMATVIAELTQAGYDCRYGFLSAYDVGAPHVRERWFLLGRRREKHSDGAGCLRAGETLADSNSKNLERPRNRAFWTKEKDSVVTSDRPKNGSNRDWKAWTTEPGIHRVVDGLPFRVDRVKRLGNSVVPQCVREAFERLAGLKKWENS